MEVASLGRLGALGPALDPNPNPTPARPRLAHVQRLPSCACCLYHFATGVQFPEMQFGYDL